MFTPSLLAVAGLFQADPTVPPSPDGWSILASEGSCSAYRRIRPGLQLSLGFNPRVGEASLLLLDSSFAAIENDRSYELTIRFAGNPSADIRVNAMGINYDSPDRRTRGLNILRLNRDFVDKLAQAEGFELVLGQSRLGNYRLMGANSAMARLIQCAEQGPPPGSQRSNLGSYFSRDDYPRTALRNREQGRVAFRLSIGHNGRVTDCVVTASSGSAALDEVTCRILRERTRYQPARDAEGNPTTGNDEGSITWVLPR